MIFLNSIFLLIYFQIHVSSEYARLHEGGFVFSEYARPHGGFSPGTLPRSAGLGLPPQCIDPMLHYQLNMYGPGARER